MSVPTFEFTDDDRGPTASSFDPQQAYNEFIGNHGENLSVDNVRIFFLRANEAKQKLRKSSAKIAMLKFGSWKVEVVNNHYPGNASNPVADNSLTLYRISGFLAKYTLELHNDSEHRAEIEEKIVNPIAESKGVTWQAGAKIYLAFFPGTVMFLYEFEMLSLAIYLYRAQKDEIDPSLLKKPLRQKYKKDNPEKWMREKKVMIQGALGRIAKLPWGTTGLSAQARDFLKEFGITMK
ncbi:nucleocapsid protein [Caraparu virus]|uniref:Nucleoprotein n=2 Tax=Caraparu virus TaxID=192196 RepID=W8CZV1_9VIRU|nr:nucleocapsid protein [Caraparu virus]AGW82136.1 nucleocapsid protein [Caraparu virus]AVX48952.1 N protein [Caraparu virus]QLA46973.1 N [Caraparu virus] [Caraparu virus]